MRYYLLIIILCICNALSAQMGIAKIKYEEAEDAYTSKQYTLCLEKLDEVVGILKSTNPRVQYLRITCMSKVIEKDPFSNPEKLFQLNKYCNNYLTEYENISDLEDKYKTVYNILESFKKFPKMIENFRW